MRSSLCALLACAVVAVALPATAQTSEPGSLLGSGGSFSESDPGTIGGLPPSGPVQDTQSPELGGGTVIDTGTLPQQLPSPVEPIPEPGTYAMLLTGLAWVVLIARRRARAHR